MNIHSECWRLFDTRICQVYLLLFLHGASPAPRFHCVTGLHSGINGYFVASLVIEGKEFEESQLRRSI